jgi:DNA-binding NarL/FixJ family response regulator
MQDDRPGTPIRIFLISHNRFFAEAAASALQSLPEIMVTGSASNLENACATVDFSAFDILLFDAPVEWRNAVASLREVKASFPAVKILILGPEPSEESGLTLIECGVSGYISKNSSVAQLASTIKAAYREEILHSPRLITMAVSRLKELSRGQDQSFLLSLREREIIPLISQGLGNKDIANRLGLSTATVKNHVHNILKKLKVGRRRDAIQKVCELQTANPSKSQLAGSDSSGQPPCVQTARNASRNDRRSKE